MTRQNWLPGRPDQRLPLRDSGPNFVYDATGALHAVDWIFNGWGGQD